MVVESRAARPIEIVQVAHRLRRAKIEGPIGFDATKKDLHKSRVMLGGESMGNLIKIGRISEVISYLDSRDAGNAT